MSKNSKKERNRYNQVAVNTLAAKYGLTRYYIRQCISGRRNALIADQLKKEYNKISKDLKHLTHKHQEL